MSSQTNAHKVSPTSFFLRKVMRQFTADQCTDLAAGLTYYAVFSIFPALLAFVSILGIIGQSDEAIDTMLEFVGGIVPGAAVDIIREPLEQFSASPGLGVGVIVGIVIALWSASGYVGAFGRAMNRIYGVQEGRPFWKLRPTQLLITIVAVLLLAIALLIVIVSGPIAESLGSLWGLGEVALTVWSIAKWPVLAVAIIAAIALLYYATPNVKQPRFRWVSVGSITALVVMLLASVAFAFYVANFSNYDRTFGSLAGIIIFLLFLWIMNVALLLGAEVDAEGERISQLKAGIPAEERVQLPPRDTTLSDKAERADAEDIALGKLIRYQAESESAPAENENENAEPAEERSKS